MNTQGALATINAALQKVKNNPSLIVSENTNMLEEKILDSLDCLMLVMELDEMCGFSVPEDVDLVADGYFKVEKLAHLLVQQLGE